MSAVTASVVPAVRVTASSLLSTAPAGTVMVVAAPAALPLLTLIGTTMSKGAPVGTTARSRPGPIARRDTSRFAVWPPSNRSVCSGPDSPKKARSGKPSIRWVPSRSEERARRT